MFFEAQNNSVQFSVEFFTSHGKVVDSPGLTVTLTGLLIISGINFSSESWYLLIRIGMKL